MHNTYGPLERILYRFIKYVRMGDCKTIDQKAAVKKKKISIADFYIQYDSVCSHLWNYMPRGEVIGNIFFRHRN